MYSFAVKYNVSYILTGANYSTECIRNPIGGCIINPTSDSSEIFIDFMELSRLLHFLQPLLSTTSLLPYLRRIRVVRPLNYISFDKNSAIQLLIDKFGWQPYPQKHFESRFTRFYEGYWLPRKFGYDTRKVQFSSLILTGQMSRSEALDQLKQPALSESEARLEFEYVAKKLRISPHTLQSLMDSPNKTFRDYRSQKYLYSIGRRLMNLLGLELGGKR